MKPYILLRHDWHAMGVDYTSSEDDADTELVLWWEAVVNLVDWKQDTKRGGWIFCGVFWTDRSADFSIQALFDHNLPRTCPVAESSKIILAGSDEDLRQLALTPPSSSGEGYRVWEYNDSLVGKDLDFRWINETRFEPRESLESR